ncbi:coatomer subunit delta isoform X2 [Parasteatoda tepidariorum]|uniref:coatomer subunit delta isoform X2 n=1 Tax=Parasteatoda tepidariorum TaxID=114398 RepID=UPI001C7190BF|nr:coatomer subunit delta isoform X2 [Parasteatoda tepidariorum]
MVLLAASVTTKSGKAIVSRQFVEMTRARIEGLLAAFPKLLTGSRQHTFVETESVRYVYQPMEKLYTLLITTKASNILEDLETLRLFTRVIPEYCKFMDETDVVNNAYNLIFAFDEIVALGYRENVNLAQIRTFVEMDSHEEKVFQAVRQTQEKEAKQKMKEKARELQKAKQEAMKKGRNPSYSSSSMNYPPSPVVGDAAPISPEAPTKQPYVTPSTRPTATGKAMKLGNKNKDIDLFVDMLKSEGLVDPSSAKSPVGAKSPTQVHTESVHLRCEEKITLVGKRDGGLDNLEVHGIVILNISDEKVGLIRVKIDNQDDKGAQSQTHPNIDKELFKSSQVIGMKNSAKPFPVNVDVGVLKWRFQTQDESHIPLFINCWPSENGNGGCDVNIEYELQNEALELNDVEIQIPVPSTPVVTECEGMYEHESRKNRLVWKLPVIDSNNKSGSMEFTCSGKPSDFFPVTVEFDSFSSFCNIKVADVVTLDNEPVKYFSESSFVAEKYEIV